MSNQITAKRSKRFIVVGSASFFLGLFIYSAVIHPLVEPFMSLPQIPGGIGTKTILLMSFSLIHAWYVLGWKHALVFFAITAAISWGYEQLGVETSLVYGKYHYTDVLGAKLGHVPIIIPIAWFMMIYPSFIIASLITFGSVSKNHNSISKIVLLALVSAAVMTAWDLVVDPYLSGPTQNAWIWEEGGQYFGVPLQNFGGWLLTTFTIYLVFSLTRQKSHAASELNLSQVIVFMPLIAYGSMMISNIIPGEPLALRYIGPIVMGIPLVIGSYRFVKNNRIRDKKIS